MIKVSVKNLVDSIREADAFVLPEMNDGTGYLYNTVYRRMTGGYSVKLSELNFDAFEQDDIDTINDLHANIFEKNCYDGSRITSTLQALTPVCKDVAYV